MDVYPAIDLRGGRVVRYVEGESRRETIYASDPVAQAERFVREGARWLHVVDMDRAFRTGTDNLEWIRRICRLGVAAVQIGGNVDTIEWARDAVRAGARRVVFGTRAALDADRLAALVEAVGAARAALAVDVRDGRPAVRGTAKPLDITVEGLLDRARRLGIGTVVYRDLSRDGLLVGAELEGAGRLQGQGVAVIIAGGVAGREDFETAAQAGVAGIIIGRALYEERFSLREALAWSRSS